MVKADDFETFQAWVMRRSSYSKKLKVLLFEAARMHCSLISKSSNLGANKRETNARWSLLLTVSHQFSKNILSKPASLYDIHLLIVQVRPYFCWEFCKWNESPNIFVLCDKWHIKQRYHWAECAVCARIAYDYEFTSFTSKWGTHNFAFYWIRQCLNTLTIKTYDCIINNSNKTYAFT